MIVMEGFNYNCFDPVLHSYVVHNKILYLEDSFQLRHLIYDPTRVTLDSISLTDVISCSNYLQPLKSGVLDTTFSNHYASYAVFPVEKDKCTAKTIRKHNYNKLNYEKFIRGDVILKC